MNQRSDPPLYRAGELIGACPSLREPIIESLLRVGETANIIAAPKSYKSYLVLYLLLCLASGRSLFGRFGVRQCDVLLIDNELHRETLAARLRAVAQAMGLMHDDFAEHLSVGKPAGQPAKHLRLAAVFFDALPQGALQGDRAGCSISGMAAKLR